MFNITDRQDRHFGVDFVYKFLCCYIIIQMYLNSLDSPNTFNYRCYSHKLASQPHIYNSNQAVVHMTNVTDNVIDFRQVFLLLQKVIFFIQRSCPNIVWSENFDSFELSEEPISIIWDSFQSGKSPSTYFFLQCLDEQNANTPVTLEAE